MKRIMILVVVNVGFFSMALSMDSDVKIEMTDPKGKSPVTPLDLTGATVQTPSGDTSRPKTPIKDFSDLTKVARTKSTQRATSLKKSQRLDSPIPPSSQVTKAASVKKTVSSGAPTAQAIPSVGTALVQKAEQVFGVKIINGKKYYSEDDVWKKIETLSPIIYTFAQKEGMDLEQTIEFANEMKGVDIGHQVFMQLAHGNLNPDPTTPSPSLWERTRNFLIGNPNRQAVSTESLNQEYEKLIKKNPNQYEVLACEALKAAYDLVEGKEQNRSPIADTHIGVQNKKINEQDATIRQQYLALVLQMAVAIGGWVLGILQTVSPTDCHHNLTA